MFLIFIDIFLCKMNIFLHLGFAFKVRNMQKDKATENEQFWKRMDFLIGDERPYPWAEEKGINRSAFQSSKTRKTKPLPKTVRDWSEKIGCSFEWLNNGEGEPFAQAAGSQVDEVVIKHEQVKTAFDNKVQSMERLDIAPSVPNQINQALLEQCFDLTDGVLESTFSTMRADDKSDYIVKLYKTRLDEVKQEFMLDEENFMLAIFTIEVALVYTRHTMSPKSKGQLIPEIYEKYHSNAEMKQATIQQLKKYREELS